jgi:cyclophilin family peptidyl-prolyl cis-trans isomerase
MKQQKQSRGLNQAPKAQPNASRWIITAVAAIALMILLFALIQTQSNEEILSEESIVSKLEWSSPPAMIIDPQKQYAALIETELGNIKIRLFDNESPITVNNFVFLAQQGYYDGVIFHRVIHDFMVQGGDQTGTGSGDGPGYMFADEVENGLKFDRPGLLAMANSGPNTNGSQFFITHVATPHLNGLHTIYGEVVEGMSTVFAIPERNPQNAKDPGIIMKKVTISEE